MEARMAESSSRRVRRITRAAPGERGHDAVDEKPRSVYELITRQMLEELKEDVAEVKGRVNTLLWLVAGAIVVELVMRAVK